MNEAILYEKMNFVQRRDAKCIINEFAKLFQWRADGYDKLLDIGCGSGDITIDYILPVLPKKFNKLVGIDISEKMITHARMKYKQPNIHFELLDVASDLPSQCFEQYDHVTSFYCLHWVQNQRKAFKNIHKLLTSKGDCLLVYLARCAIFDVYKELSSRTKWYPYMKDVNNYLSPLQYSEYPNEDVRKMIINAGFKDYIIEVRDLVFTYDNVESLKQNIKAVNPFTGRMSEDLQEEFLNDYIGVLENFGLKRTNVTNGSFCFISPYKLVITFAKKHVF